MTITSWLNVLHKFVVISGVLALALIVSGAGAGVMPTKLENPEWVESLLKPKPEIPLPLITNDCHKNSVKYRIFSNENICSSKKLSRLTNDNATI